MFKSGKSRKIALKKSGQRTALWRFTQFFVPILLALILYSPILYNGFTFDDFKTVIGNQCVDGTLSIGEALARDYWCMSDNQSNGSWRPLTVLVLRSIYSIFEDWAPAFHFLSLFLYLLLVALSMRLAYILTENNNITAFTGLIFAAHPVHTEAVASITSLADLLSAFFVFWSFVVYAGILKDPAKWQRRWMAIPLMFMGVLSKESAATGFGVLILFDLAMKLEKPQIKIFFKEKGLSGSKLWVPWALAVVTWGVYLSIKQQALGQLVPHIVGQDNILAQTEGISYYATAFSAVFEYLRLLVFPLRLSIDYSFNQIPLETSIFSLRALIALITMAVSILAGLAFIKNRFTISFAILMIWISLSISTNLVILIPSIVAERLLLVPSFGICLLLGILLERFRPPVGSSLRLLFIIGTTLLLLAASYKTVSRNLEWYNNTTLFKEAVKTSPESKKVQVNMGWFYRTKSLWKEALKHYEKAYGIGRVESDAFLHREIGLCHHALGNMSEALNYYKMALKINPADKTTLKLKEQAQNKEIPPDLSQVPR